MTSADRLPRARPQPVRMERHTALPKDRLFVSWELGNTCNYTCSYCPTHLHDGSRYWPSRDDVLRFAERMIDLARSRGKSVHIQLTGGEVTLMPRFQSLLKGLASRGCRLSIISNGSRSLRWWKETCEHLDFVSLTFHPESADIEHFEGVVRLLSSRVRTIVCVAALPAMFEYSVRTIERLSRTCCDVTLILKPLFVEFGENLYPYTAEQLRVLSSRQFTSERTQPILNPRMLIAYDDGTAILRSAAAIVADRANAWPGWECDVGLEQLAINMWGEIYRGECQEDGKLGDVSEPELFTLPSAPVTCTKTSCNCLLDIMASRRSAKVRE
jgi:organic radical activating enzyme